MESEGEEVAPPAAATTARSGGGSSHSSSRADFGNPSNASTPRLLTRGGSAVSSMGGEAPLPSAAPSPRVDGGLNPLFAAGDATPRSLAAALAQQQPRFTGGQVAGVPSMSWLDRVGTPNPAAASRGPAPQTFIPAAGAAAQADAARLRALAAIKRGSMRNVGSRG